MTQVNGQGVASNEIPTGRLTIEEQQTDAFFKVGFLAAVMSLLGLLVSRNGNLSFYLSLFGGALNFPYRPSEQMDREGTATVTIGLRLGSALVFGRKAGGQSWIPSGGSDNARISRDPVIVGKVYTGKEGVCVHLVPFDYYAGGEDGKFACIFPWGQAMGKSNPLPSLEKSEVEKLFAQAVRDISEVFAAYMPKPKS